MVDIYEQNPLQRLYAAGQSVWYDNIRRGVVLYGELEAMVAGDAVTGITSNPTIFHKAVTASAEYDQAIADLAREGLSASEVVDILMAQDIQMAADVLRPVWEGTHGKDGWVSIEVAPSLAHDAAATVADVERLAYMVDRPNVLVKVPATVEGVEAIRTLVGRGACINVTLIFSLERHRQVMEAYIAGLEELAGRLAAGEEVPPLSAVGVCARFQLGAVQGHVTQLDEAGLLTEAKDLGEEATERREMAFAKRGDGVVVGVLVAGKDAVGDFFVGGALQLAGRGLALGVSVDEELEEHGRVISGAAAKLVFLVGVHDERQIQRVDHVGDEEGEVVGREPLFQAGRKQILLVEIIGQEVPGHEHASWVVSSHTTRPARESLDFTCGFFPTGS